MARKKYFFSLKYGITNSSFLVLMGKLGQEEQVSIYNFVPKSSDIFDWGNQAFSFFFVPVSIGVISGI